MKNSLQGQEHLRITGGIGMPDLLNAGIMVNMGQNQLGVNIGTIPSSNGYRMFSLSGNLYMHMAGTPKYTEIKPWYFMGGINYLKDETNHFLDKYIYLNLRVGWEKHFSKRWGMCVDAGILFQLSYTTVEKDPSYWSLFPDREYPILPSGSVKLFFKL